MNGLAGVVFWSAFILIVYHHIGYPALIRLLLTLRRPKPQPVTAVASGDYPTVTVIVPAHNEAAVIEAKVRNLAALDYPHDRLNFVLALDGCTDRTRDVVEATLTQVGPGRFIVEEYMPNIGKVAVLNDQIARSRADLIALTDASALIPADAIWKGAAPFLDAKVGVVTGRYSVAELEGRGEAAYWRYQSNLRSDESSLIGPMGAHGAFYLFRRSKWEPLPPHTINDDFVLPMSIVLRGFKAVFVPSIVATELEGTKSGQEFRRRVRIGAGNLQQVIRLAKLADPRRGWTAFIFVSGKGIRGVLPFLFAVMLVSSIISAAQESRFFTLVVLAELATIAFASFGGKVPGIRTSRLGGPALYVLEGYLAITVGAALVLTGREDQVWGISKAKKI